ncbi:RNA polymerase sigma factor [Dysgonomonas termitidis]|uniref:RNA polymerase sigma factor n=1 Tax=Dysgonomonas termitidis TaxID=1516126 RepID=A0ABV9KTM1_9BACT
MDKKQFIEQVVSLKVKLKNYAFNMLSNKEDADDVVQEAFLRLWDMRCKLDSHTNISALSIQVTKFICLNVIRQRKLRSKLNDISVFKEDMFFLEKELSYKEDAEIINQIIDNLPPMQKSLLKMKHLEGLEIDEIAAITGSDPSAIRMNLSRARKKIQEMYFKVHNYGK